MPEPIDYLRPVPSYREDLPEGLALFGATAHPSSALELLELSHHLAIHAASYRDNVLATALANGALTYAQAARVMGVTRQALHTRFSPSVEAFRAAVPDPLLWESTP